MVSKSFELEAQYTSPVRWRALPGAPGGSVVGLQATGRDGCRRQAAGAWAPGLHAPATSFDLRVTRTYHHAVSGVTLGETVAHYRLLDKLGEGSMGVDSTPETR